MKTTIHAQNLSPYESNSDIKFSLDLPTKCPCCGTAYSRIPEYTNYFQGNSGIITANSTYFCPTCGKCFFAKNSRFRRSAGADSKKPPVFVENALRFLWNTLKMKSIFCTILLKNAYLSLHFASFRV